MKTNRFLPLAANLSLAIVLLTFIGCGPTRPQSASLSKGMPESFFLDAKIDIYDSEKVSYTFESKLDDQFLYRTANDPFDGIGKGGFIDLNKSYRSVLENYINYKYTPVESGDEGYHIDVILEECTYEEAKAGSVTAQGGASISLLKITTNLAVKVRINVNGNVSEKKITGIGEATGNWANTNTVTNSFDLAIRATISRMDRFLNSAINAATTD
jgi:hypothetical protein